MARPKLVVINSEQSEHSRGGREGKMYRFELSRRKAFLYDGPYRRALLDVHLRDSGRQGCGSGGSDDFSLKAGFFRFLGLDKQVGQPSTQASETWGDPRKMLETLNYYEDLTKQGGVPVTAPPKPVDLPARCNRIRQRTGKGTCLQARSPGKNAGPAGRGKAPGARSAGEGCIQTFSALLCAL